MKKSLITALVVGVTTFSSPTPINTINPNPENQTKTIVIQKTGLELFLHSLGKYESNNDYTKVNKWGYLGKYQFSKRTLRGLGYKVKPEVFLNNPQLQEQAVMDLLIDNKRVMKKHIIEYTGKTINNIKITESGILAATHLVGPRSVKRYLKSNGKRIKKDALGTSVEDYMKTFGGYNLEI
jgi:hypothetical protein